MSQKNFDEFQWAAVCAPVDSTGVVSIIAGPGSGKTSVLLERARFIASGLSSPLLLLTFSNFAVSNLRSRLLPHENFTVLTFHALALKLVSRFYPKQINVTDYDLSYMEGIIRARGYSFSSQLVFDFARRACPLTDSFSLVLQDIYSQYCDHLLEQNLMDFDMLVAACFEVLSDETNLTWFVAHYPCVLVDEFQDTEPVQLRIFDLLRFRLHISVVLDLDQLIYSFRQVNPSQILDFVNASSVVYLKFSYRCPSSILSASYALISHNKSRLKNLCSSSKNLCNFVVYGASHQEEEFSYIRSLISQYLPLGKTVAVLCRSNRLVSLLRSNLKLEASFNNSMEVLVLFSYYVLCFRLLGYYVSVDYLRKALFYALSSFNGVGSRTIALVQSLSVNGFWQNFLDLASKNVRLSPFLLFFEDLSAKLASYSSSLVKESDLVSNLTFLWSVSALSSLYEFQSVVGFFQFLNVQRYDFFQVCDYLFQNEYVLNKGVNILTVHSAKGLEFDLVIVPFLLEKYFPMDSSDIESERRLMFVAMTRSSQSLFLTYSLKNSFFSEALPSRFLLEFFPNTPLYLGSVYSLAVDIPF